MSVNPLQETVAAEVPATGRSHPLVNLFRRRGLRAVLQILLGAGALAWLIARSDRHALLEAVSSTRLAYLPLAILTTVAVYWLMAYRWRLMLAVRGHRIHASSLFAYFLISIFFNNFIPGGNMSGDVVRFIYVDRIIHDKPFVLSTLVYEKFTGLFAVTFFVLGATLISRTYLPAGLAVYLAEAAVALIFLVMLSLASERLSGYVVRLTGLIGKRARIERAGAGAGRALEAISELRRHKAMIVQTLILTLVIRAAWSLGFVAVARAMSLPLELPAIFAFVSLVDLIRMLPITPNGIGLREGAFVLLLASVGIGREQALMFSLLGFAPLLLMAVAGGVIYISRARWRNKRA
jgi:uncharacterized protein (TIRG00374 family)